MAYHDVIQKQYFTYSLDLFKPFINRVLISDLDVGEKLTELENGAKLLDIIPQIEIDFKVNSLNYAMFEIIDEIDYFGQKFISSSGFKRVGKLLLPNYKVISRSKLESKLDILVDKIDIINYKHLLDNYPNVEYFYSLKNNKYSPLVLSDILVLDRTQL